MSFKKRILCTGLLVLTIVSISKAQSSSQSDALLVEKIMVQLQASLSDVPVSIQRVAVFRLNYNENSLSKEDMNYVVARVEETLKNFSPITIIAPPELEPTNQLKIFGRDSTIQISNSKGRSLAESNTELLIQTGQKYSIHALLEISVQRKAIEGYSINLKMINPNSQEVVWVKSFVSNPIYPKEEKDKGRLTLLRVGVETMAGKSFTVANVTTDSEQQILNYNASLIIRQPIDSENLSYFGIVVGINILKGVEDSLYNATLLNAGTIFQYGLGEKKESINANRLLLTLGADVRFALTKYEGSIFTISPGLQFNLTEVISIGAYARNIISGDELSQKDENQSITFNRLSYGLQCVFRF